MISRGLAFGLVFLVTGSAFGADLSSKTSPIGTDPAVNWTGVYIGASAGGDWGNVRGAFLNAGTLYQHGTSGGLVGAQFGFMKQWDQLVAGAEIGFSGIASSGKSNCPNSVFVCSDKANTLFEATGSLGWAFDKALVYGKAGWGLESIASTVTPPFPAYNDHRAMEGLIVGFGGKYEVAPNWDIGLEYEHLSLNSRTFAPGSPVNIRVLNGGDNIVRATLSYRFNFAN